MIIITTQQVYTGPAWLVALFDGFTNARGTARIVVHYDAYNRPVIDKNIALHWDLSMMVAHPETGEARPLLNWLEEIPFCYEEEPS